MHRRLVILVGILFTIISPGQLPAAEEIAAELVGLNVSLAAEKQLVVYEQLFAAGEWTSAIDLLDRLSADQSGALVKVAPGRYVGLQVAVQQRLTQLPPAGLEVYGRRANANASASLIRARGEHDSAKLWSLVEDSAATPAAQAALKELADQAASRGDLELALRLWCRMKPPSLSESQVLPASLLRLVPADVQEIQATARKILIARRLLDVPLTATELKILAEDMTAGSGLVGVEWDDSTPEMTAASNASPDLGPVRWSTAVTSNCPLPQFQTPISAVPGREDLLLLNNGYSVRAIRQQTGGPYWPTGQADDLGIVWEDPDAPGEANTDIPCRIAGGLCANDCYFGILGDVPRWRLRPELIPLSGSLIALDLADGQGRLKWRIESRDLPESGWQFHGFPALAKGELPGGDLVIVPICRPGAPVELAVAAFFADDGRLAWWTRIGTSVAEAGYTLSDTQLLTRAGLVVARTLSGVVIALDTRQGRIQWASTALVSSPPTSQGSHASLLDVRAGWLTVGNSTKLPNDESSQVAGLSLDSGDLLWRHEIPYLIQGIVNTGQGRVLVAGQRLRAISLQDGHAFWEYGTDTPSAAGTGAPCVYNSTVLWPTRTGITGVDLSTGIVEFERRLTVEPVAQSMKLVSSNSYWMLSRPDAILCLPDNLMAKPQGAPR